MWLVNELDTLNPAILQAAGNVGVRVFTGTGVTNLPLITRFDDLLVTQLSSATRSIAYAYDGLQRLTGATEGCTDGPARSRPLCYKRATT